MITQCPNCRAKFKARDDWVGKEVKCPQCKKPFRVAQFVAEAKAAAGSAVVKEAAKPAEPVRKPSPQPAPEPTYERPGSVELSDTLYVYSVVCALGVSVITLFLGQRCMRDLDRASVIFGGVLFAMGVVLGIYSTVIRFVLYYKMWGAIQDGYARTSAGKAVGLLLVPVVDIFWAVYMFVGFAQDFNSFADRHSIRAERLSKTMFLQYAILWIFLDISFVVLFLLPALGVGRSIFGSIYASLGPGGDFRYVVMAWKMSNIVCTIWLLIVYIILSSKICRAVNEI